MARVVRVSDLDADGDFDLIATSPFDDTLNLYENVDGRGNFGPRVMITDQVDGVADVTIADLDGDGDLDLATASSVDSKIAWYRNELPVAQLPGDLNRNGTLDAEDITVFCRGYRSQSDSPHFDLDGDGRLDDSDRDRLIRDIFQSDYGDSNLDGIYNSSDLVLVFRAGQYEDNVALNSTWQTGDWDCDGDFGTSDLVFSFQRSTFSRAARTDASLARASLDTVLKQQLEQQPDQASRHRATLRSLDQHRPTIEMASRDLLFAQQEEDFHRPSLADELADITSNSDREHFGLLEDYDA